MKNKANVILFAFLASFIGITGLFVSDHLSVFHISSKTITDTPSIITEHNPLTDVLFNQSDRNTQSTPSKRIQPTRTSHRSICKGNKQKQVSTNIPSPFYFKSSHFYLSCYLPTGQRYVATSFLRLRSLLL